MHKHKTRLTYRLVYLNQFLLFDLSKLGADVDKALKAEEEEEVEEEEVVEEEEEEKEEK